MSKATSGIPKGGEYKKGTSFYYRSRSKDFRNRYDEIVRAPRGTSATRLNQLRKRATKFEPTKSSPYGENPRSRVQARSDIARFKRR